MLSLETETIAYIVRQDVYIFIMIQEAGDFANVAYFVLRNRCPEHGKYVRKVTLDQKVYQ